MSYTVFTHHVANSRASYIRPPVESEVMFTTDADSKADRASLATPEARTDVTEVWPGRFALEIETGGEGLSTTTTVDLDTDELRALADRIDDALENAH